MQFSTFLYAVGTTDSVLIRGVLISYFQRSLMIIELMWPQFKSVITQFIWGLQQIIAQNFGNDGLRPSAIRYFHVSITDIYTMWWLSILWHDMMQDPHYFVKANQKMGLGHNENYTTMRTFYYPPLPPSSEIKPGQLRCGEHALWICNSAIPRSKWRTTG